MNIIDILSRIKINQYDIATVIWNIFLAAIPLLLCLVLEIIRKNTGFKKYIFKIIGAIVGFLWFIFVPNTAYIITDVRHLMDYCPKSYFNVCIENSWMILFFFSYGIVGWIFLIFSLRQMKNFIKRITMPEGILQMSFIPLIIPVISIGVMIGLINRDNSWEVFFNIQKLISDISIYFTDVMYFKNLLIYMIFLYVLYFSGNYLFKKNRLTD